MMNKNDLINDFISGETKGKASNLYIEGDKLVNYSTVIAFRCSTSGHSDIIFVNTDYYSMTTRQNQCNIIRSMYYGYKIPDEKAFYRTMSYLKTYGFTPELKEQLEMLSLNISMAEGRKEDRPKGVTKKMAGENLMKRIEEFRKFLITPKEEIESKEVAITE